MFQKHLSSIFILMSIFSFFSAKAQIESRAYSGMLYALLSHSVTEIGIDDLKELQKEGNIVVLDAREPNEYKVSHIKNAKYIGYDKFDMASVKDIPKDKKIIVYCSVGYRSEKIAEKLNKAGFTDVSNLYGGVFEWVNQDNPVYIDAKTTKKVHAFDSIWGIWLNKGEKVY